MTEPHERAILIAAETIVQDHAIHATRFAARRRRLRRALADLGLDRILGDNWCAIGDDGFDFAHLNARQADQLTCALEDLTQRLIPKPAPRPGPGQGSFGF